ncbi:MAG: ATP-binding protein [Calothrix sp. C42_A2020_038]|nr:ATP-binding protein [Calothrix sp. C42_A2020_038]
MNDLEQWHKGNEQYLKTALTWLRLRLSQLGDDNDEMKQAAEAMAVAEATNPPPALMILSQRLGLSRFEQQVLLLCAAIELDTSIASLCAHAQEDSHRPYPTFALALTLFAEAAWDVLSPERPLRYWRLIEINQPGAQPLTISALRADERIVNFLKGLNYLDDRLSPLLMPLEIAVGQDQLPPSQQSGVENIIRHLQQPTTRHNPPIIQLLGADIPSKQLVATHCAQTLGLHLYRLPIQLLPANIAELETFIRLWQRESFLLPLALYVEACELESGQKSTLYRFLLRTQGVIFLDTRDVQLELGCPTLPIDVAKPTLAEQQAAWSQFLGASASPTPALLAGQFNLSLTVIKEIALNEEKMNEKIWDACLVRTRPQLDALAQRLNPKATWDDIVLPKDALDLLQQTANQVQQRSLIYENWGFHRQMNRGFGISALFAGDSGTGKTMAAEVIANDLRLNLYRIDLSAVVSKYIGETEKNLRRLFDAAEDGGAILFFDEADALFGKRSEVKDSHDRYANIEINYLLQRMEAYRGLAILATNMKSALDTAFLRRLRFVIDFPFPGIAERKDIWQRAFPPETPTQDLDFGRLAHLNLTGGSIHNIALNAAFLAAREGTHVTMPLILNAARTELRKMERPINEADFRYAVLGVGV